MATKSKETIPKMKSSKIIGIQFSILSPDEIRKGSVAEITSRDTYINNKPVIGGLFDPRMGVLDHGKKCPTDELDNRHCPGYFGHIELAKPLFYHQFFETVKNQCIAVIKFSGFANEKNCAAKHLELLNILNKNNITFNNDFMIAVYQPPYQIINRKNEIWVEVNPLEVKNILLKK